MANADLTDQMIGNDNEGRRRVREVETVLDCATSPREANDVVNLFPVKAGQRVLHTRVVVETAEGAAVTLDVGDGAGASGYQSAVNGNVVAATDMALALTEGAPNTVTGYTGGKTYAADDTVDMVFSAAASAAKIKVQALIADFA